MTGEPTDAGPESAWSPSEGDRYEDITPTVNRQVLFIMEREDTHADLRPALRRGYWLPHDELHAVVAAPVVIFAKSYIETLAKHAGDATWDLSDRIRFRRRRRIGETRLEVDGGAAATVVVTEDLPDEARLKVDRIETIVKECAQ